MLEEIIQSVHRHLDGVVELRHRLHQVPEPGLSEFETSALILDELGGLNLAIQSGIDGTGIIADLDGAHPGGTVILRADMDALPVQESTHLPYQSLHNGLSHACGHDGHAACLLGAAKVLHDLRPRLAGRIRFVFQPAEELNRGATAMIAHGLLDSHPLPTAIVSLHVWPGLPTDCVACRPGPMMASSDAFTVNVFGRGGHGARPHLARNPLKGIVRIIDTLSTIAVEGAIISPCVVRVGEQSNVIADSGLLRGTIRALNPEVRQRALAALEETAHGVCSELEMSAVVHLQDSCPAVANDPGLYETFRTVAQALLGEGKAVRLPHPSMGSEDFGHYLQHLPGLYFRLGSGTDSPDLHSSGFDFNDAALETGILMLAGLAIRLCSGPLDEP